jgi:hypothetical protein
MPSAHENPRVSARVDMPICTFICRPPEIFCPAGLSNIRNAAQQQSKSKDILFVLLVDAESKVFFRKNSGPGGRGIFRS